MLEDVVTVVIVVGGGLDTITIGFPTILLPLLVLPITLILPVLVWTILWLPTISYIGNINVNFKELKMLENKTENTDFLRFVVKRYIRKGTKF